MSTRQCPRCGNKTRRVSCCGIRLKDGWKMNDERWRFLRHLAFTRKGLDSETWRDNLHAVGARKAKALTKPQFTELVDRLQRLPDSPAYVAQVRQSSRQTAA